MSGNNQNSRSSRQTEHSSSGASPEQICELINQGADLLQLGKSREAIPLLERAYAHDPSNVVAALNLGGAYIVAGKHRLAVPILEQACSREPDNAMLWMNLGAAFLDRPPYATPDGEEKAIHAFQRAFELDPSSSNVSYNLALIFKDRGDLSEAIAWFEKTLRVNPHDRDASRWIQRLQGRLENGPDEASMEV